MLSTRTATSSSRSTLWDDYIDPAFRERRPRFVIDDNGKERLSVEGKLLGNPRGIGSLGSVGVRQGERQARQPEICRRAQGRVRPARPHRRHGRLTASTPLSSTRASACSPAPSRIPASPPRCAAPTTAGSPITASRIPTGCSGSRCCRCSRSSWRSRRCVTRAKTLGMRGGFLRPNPYHGKKMIERPDVRAVLADGRRSRLLDRLP